jgi:hypothetical protein
VVGINPGSNLGHGVSNHSFINIAWTPYLPRHTTVYKIHISLHFLFIKLWYLLEQVLLANTVWTVHIKRVQWYLMAKECQFWFRMHGRIREFLLIAMRVIAPEFGHTRTSGRPPSTWPDIFWYKFSPFQEILSTFSFKETKHQRCPPGAQGGPQSICCWIPNIFVNEELMQNFRTLQQPLLGDKQRNLKERGVREK